MDKSDSIANIAPALVKAQAKIKAALKDSTNPHFKSKYADLESVVDAVKGPLNEQGITFLQAVYGADSGPMVETMLLHTSGEWLSSTLQIPASKHDAQGFGSAITYGRRYGLQAMCGVPSADDDGNAATAAPPKSKITPVAGSLDNLSPDERELAKRTASQIVDLWDEGKEIAAYEAYYKGGHSNEMMLGIWEVLQPHSKIRNTLKKMHTTEREAA